MSRLRTGWVSTLWLVCVAFGVAAQADSTALKQQADAVIDQAVAGNRIVGAVVLVAQDGKVVYERARPDWPTSLRARCATPFMKV